MFRWFEFWPARSVYPTECVAFPVWHVLRKLCLSSCAALQHYAVYLLHHSSLLNISMRTHTTHTLSYIRSVQSPFLHCAHIPKDSNVSSVKVWPSKTKCLKQTKTKPQSCTALLPSLSSPPSKGIGCIMARSNRTYHIFFFGFYCKIIDQQKILKAFF